MIRTNLHQDYAKAIMTIPIWSCHWNSKMDIRAQVAWMNPLDATESLTNAADLIGRLAVSLRGGVTFVHKARIAQVIICIKL